MSSQRPRYALTPPPGAERLITAQIVQHGARLDKDGRPMPECILCGPLPGMTLAQHQARSIRDRLVQAGLLSEDR